MARFTDVKRIKQLRLLTEERTAARLRSALATRRAEIGRIRSDQTAYSSLDVSTTSSGSLGRRIVELRDHQEAQLRMLNRQNEETEVRLAEALLRAGCLQEKIRWMDVVERRMTRPSDDQDERDS